MDYWTHRSWLASSQFQYAVLLFLVFWTLAVLGVLYAVVNDVTTSLYLFLPDTPQGKMLRQTIGQKTNLILVSVAVGMLLIDLLIGIYSLQKIVGPLQRFHRHILADARNGKLSPLHFRKGDHFPHLAEAYTELQERIHPESGETES
jgi:hypothetical protein